MQVKVILKRKISKILQISCISIWKEVKAGHKVKERCIREVLQSWEWVGKVEEEILGTKAGWKDVTH